jgi:hypothetical protein
MKQRNRKRLVSAKASRNAKPQAAVRSLTAQDRAALRSISESGLFSLEASRGMYADVRGLRPVIDEKRTTTKVKP